MYTNYLSAQSVSLRVSYSDQQQSKVRDGQTADEKANSEQASAEETKNSSGFADILSIMSNDITPIENIRAYVQDSVAKVLEKIASHSSKNISDQAGTYSVSVTSITINIELKDGETLNDVKSELDSMLSKDGYWGVEKTSQRMFDFAAAIAGDDPDQLEKARDAVTKGFKQAEAMFGGKLPQISYDTYQATMDKFDNYMERITSSLETTYA